MKKIIIIISLIAVMFILAGCGSTDEKKSADSTVDVKAQKMAQLKAAKGIKPKAKNFAGQAVSNMQACMESGCPFSTWPGDSICDDQCNTQECNYDDGDCNATTASALCATGCPASWPGDNWCDPQCNNAACNFDDGDCEGGATNADLCAPGCLAGWSPDNWCDEGCNNAACDYDGGDCTEEVTISEDSSDVTVSVDESDLACSESGCTVAFLGDGECDSACNNAVCNYDGGDCGAVPVPASNSSNGSSCVPAECVYQDFAGGIKDCGVFDDGCGGTINCNYQVYAGGLECPSGYECINQDYAGGIKHQCITVEVTASNVTNSSVGWENWPSCYANGKSTDVREDIAAGIDPNLVEGCLGTTIANATKYGCNMVGADCNEKFGNNCKLPDAAHNTHYCG